MTITSHDPADWLSINDLIIRERGARDAGLWSEMSAFYHPNATVDISWFTGSGVQFAAATQQAANRPPYTFHQMGASAITILGGRALVDSNCTVHAFTTMDGVEVDVVSYCRLQWRAQRSDANWLIAGLRSIYIRDVLSAVNPQQVPEMDYALLTKFRPSYRHIAYVIEKSGSTVRNDLPGVDRPETITKLRAGEQKWLSQDSI